MLLAGNAGSLPLIILPPRLRRSIEQRLISATFRVFLWGARRCGLMRLDLSALDALNHERGLILVANHPSMIDVFLVISRVKEAICLMKASIASNLFLGTGAFLAGYVSNRETAQMIKQAAQAVQRGDRLLIFPEGTRTTRQPINDIKAGAVLIAKRAQAPIQTILLTTNSGYLSKGWPIWRPPVFPLIYRAQLGVRFEAQQLNTMGPGTLQRAFESYLSLSIQPDLAL
jgi:1-acyl-sn-glycerol-3-phosphate acyltransferase